MVQSCTSLGENETSTCEKIGLALEVGTGNKRLTSHVPIPFWGEGSSGQNESRRRGQELLREQLEPCGVDPLGWWWMTNLVHLFAAPHREDALSRPVMWVNSGDSRQFNPAQRLL